MARTESSSIPERRSSSRVGDTCNVETELTATDPAVARVTYKSRLHQMTQTTPTMLWNDSADIGELIYAIENGAVGATCNPVIAVGILKKEIAVWRPRIEALLHDLPGATEDRIGWTPAFAAHAGRDGRLSIQTDPRFFRDSEAILEHAMRFSLLAPNVIVKIPATRAGVVAIEEATYRGLSVNATVCFTLPQCIAVAEAVERGLRRRESEGKEIASMGPVCTIMVGRLDDWLKVLLDKREITVDPGILEWAGVAVFKKTYGIFRQRGYRLRLLSAAFRNHMHWSELIGADAVISPPSAWQKRFNAGDIEVRPRIDDPVDPEVLGQLLSHFPDFRRAYSEDGLTVDEFDSFAPTVRTLRQFIAACTDLAGLVRDVMLPEPA